MPQVLMPLKKKKKVGLHIFSMWNNIPVSVNYVAKERDIIIIWVVIITTFFWLSPSRLTHCPPG